MTYKRAGVVGAGVMGRGLAQSLAASGLEVVLVDLREEILEEARRDMAESLRLSGLFQKKEAAGPEEIFGRIRWAIQLEALADCDFVVENITEKEELKAEIYPRLDEICEPEVPFAATT